jgi:plasmid maintenance system antidote protein VapI
MRTVPLMPHTLLDTLIEFLKLKNDAALARTLEVAPPVVSKVRNHTLPLGPSLIVKISEVTDWNVKTIRELAAAA